MLSLLLLLIVAQDTGPATAVDDILVTGHRVDPLVSVEVDGALDENVLISSNPASIRCGGYPWRYSPSDAPRQCWIRRPTGAVIELTARVRSGQTIAWTGCEVQADPLHCNLVVSQDAHNIHAVVRGG